ncbi:maleylacetoacetate isomerase [Stappia taiwanensis]|uniref:Maleylacetoacetate isomerase n=1 Tax=Stappia taiwanensis TaxID=992267 RepID=A0A838XYH7_9HYPH|nr:maleylacetoacetate isomerase [Stappia taiwanensis]MBA4611820.1 maleylacetoacetate isomerase [Stappia taiwanensis]GGF03000.1 maleylacetoacetate isomerase [Stappia taiwanensis]
MTRPVLYDYWRSSASYRVRIALNLAGIEHDTVAVDLLAGTHRSAEHLARNPQGLVPALKIDGQMLTQSLAIIEYLNDTRPEGGLLPPDALGRQRVRAISHAIAMEIHPVCNLRVVKHIVELAGGGDEIRNAWMQQYISSGLAAVETLLDAPGTGLFCHGDTPTMADLCLVPQLYNARRWGANLDACPRVVEIGERCEALTAFAAAHPDQIGPPAA